MATRTKKDKGYKQQYSSNGINASSAGRTGQTSRGRFKGGRQGFTDPDTGKPSVNGKMISRRQQDYQVRKGIRNWELENQRKFGTLPGEGNGRWDKSMALATG